MIEQTPLHLAAINGKEEVVLILLDCGASKSALDVCLINLICWICWICGVIFLLAFSYYFLFRFFHQKYVRFLCFNSNDDFQTY